MGLSKDVTMIFIMVIEVVGPICEYMYMFFFFYTTYHRSQYISSDRRTVQFIKSVFLFNIQLFFSAACVCKRSFTAIAVSCGF